MVSGQCPDSEPAGTLPSAPYTLLRCPKFTDHWPLVTDHYVPHPDDAAVSGGQGTPSWHAVAVPHGGLLRALRRRRRAGGPRPRPDVDQSGQDSADGGLPAPPTGKLSAKAPARRPPRRHLRP